MDKAAFMEEKLHNDPRGKKEESGVPKHFLPLNGVSVLRSSRLAKFNRAQTAAGWIARN